MTYSEDELIPISALQHMVFCERQAALIHIEGLWEENVLTVEGHQLHERAHEQEAETSGNIHTVRGLRIRSLNLGLIGMADVVEFRHTSTDDSKMAIALKGLPSLWKPLIVEYKRGKPKIDRSDEVQVCAQALCLEEMLGVSIEQSAIFYGRPRRRHLVSLDTELRHETEEIATKTHSLILAGKTPAAIYSRKCRRCSLIDSCLPRSTGSRKKVQRYIEKAIQAGGEE